MDPIPRYVGTLDVGFGRAARSEAQRPDFLAATERTAIGVYCPVL